MVVLKLKDAMTSGAFKTPFIRLLILLRNMHLKKVLTCSLICGICTNQIIPDFLVDPAFV